MKSSQTHYPSLIGFLSFAVAALLLFTLGIVLGLSALFVYLREGATDAQSTTYSLTMFFLGSLLGVVSIVSLLRHLNKPFADAHVSTSFEGWKIAAGVIGTALALFVGNSLRGNMSINWLVLPLMTIPAVALPIWTIAGLGARTLTLGSRWRAWSALGISLTVTPFILFMLETLVLIVILLFVVFYVAANPEVAAEFQRLSSQFMFVDMESEAGLEQALRLMSPYLLKPGVIIPAMAFFTVLVPLTEELIKPLAVWLFVNKLENASQGFALGALCGAGFALWETFNVGGQIADWGVLLFSRIGTGLLHITTSALMGGAIFAALRARRYLRLLGTYLLVVLLHGLWNASAVAMSVSALMATNSQLAGYAAYQWISTAGLICLGGVLFAILISSNRRHSKTMALEKIEDPTQNELNV